MLTVSKIPTSWVAALRKIQVQFPEAVIAGGALRDLDNGRPVKDVDVFVYHRETARHDLIEALDLVGMLIVPETVGDYIPSMADVVSVTEFGPIDLNDPYSPNLSVITMEPGTDILRRIDFGLCQIATDGSTIQETYAYVQDQWAKTFTMTRADNQAQYDRSIERFNRLSVKYSGFRLVIPIQFAAFAPIPFTFEELI